MGLLKVAMSAVGGTMADQWLEYFYCDSLSNDVLVTKGKIRTNGSRNGNTKGNDNIISNGSVIAVNEGQCMIIVDQGEIVEFCADAGEFKYDTSSEPSLFCGKLGSNILGTFKTIGKRFAFGGNTGKDQRVYFFNIKEIIDNKFGTPNPIPFRVVDRNIGLDLDCEVRCNGEYTFKIVDPLLFYKNICGNVAGEYRKEQILSQMKAEFISALSPALSEVSDLGIRYSEINRHSPELSAAINKQLEDSWGQRFGIRVENISMGPITLPPETSQMIKDLQRTAVFRSADMAAANLSTAQADAMKMAASNTAAGPMMAFASMNMASNAGGFNANDLYAMAAQQRAQQPAPAAPAAAPVLGWTCSCGHADNKGKFCAECGAKKPEAAGWTCSCGAVNQGKFCAECGAKKPEGAPLYKCDKCGWEPEDPTNPPKFCPECGDIFDANDIR